MVFTKDYLAASQRKIFPFSVKMLRAHTSTKSAIRTAAAQVKPPVKLYSTEGRYATALYTVAAGQQKLADAEKDMKVIKKLLETNKDFKYETIPIQ